MLMPFLLKKFAGRIGLNRYNLVSPILWFCTHSGIALDLSSASSSKKSPPPPPPPVLILLSGFPDTASSWSRLSPHFASTHHILALAMPGYEDDTLPPHLRWGYRLPDIVSAFSGLIQPYKDLGCPIHLVGHDWGALIVLLFAAAVDAINQGPTKLIDKLVVLDVGVVDLKELNFKQIAVMLCYQGFFAFIFYISRFLPREGWALPLLLLYPWSLIGPTPYEVIVLAVVVPECRSPLESFAWFFTSVATHPHSSLAF